MTWKTYCKKLHLHFKNDFIILLNTFLKKNHCKLFKYENLCKMQQERWKF